jgi:hypothetical protein
LWKPGYVEKLLENAKVRQKLLEQEVRIQTAKEQAEWLARQTERLALIAFEIDEAERRSQMAEEMEKRENWWRQVSEREKKQNEAIMADFQKRMEVGCTRAND